MCESHESHNSQDVEDIVKPLKEIKNFPLVESIVRKMLGHNITSREEMELFIKKEQREHSISIGNSALLYVYRVLCRRYGIQYDNLYETLLQKKSFRSQSGVMVFAIVTSPYPNGQEFSCQWNCKYCPLEPGQPRSYFKSEPGVQRANRHNFDPVHQFRDRGYGYFGTGHPVDKCEVIVLGGTWNSYQEDYRIDFIRKIYYAANTFFDSHDADLLRPILSLEEEMKMNETTDCKIIGLTIETRPDCVNPEELKKLRQLGVTRIQMGVQHIDDRMLERVDRRCKSSHTIEAIEMLKNNCFKIDIHLMPDLPKPLMLGVDPKKRYCKQMILIGIMMCTMRM